MFMKAIQPDFSILFLLLAMTVFCLQAQAWLAQTSAVHRLKLAHITVALGLSQSSVHCMLPDRQDFMWHRRWAVSRYSLIISISYFREIIIFRCHNFCCVG